MRYITNIICLTAVLFFPHAAIGWSADFQKGFEAFESKDYATALKEWRPLARQGEIFAQRSLGLMYELGLGVQPNDKLAARWYTLAAEQGDAAAQFSIGRLYVAGDGVVQDYKSAVKWFTRAANQGSADAQYRLGKMHAQGKGVEQDYVEAVKWLRRAAEQGVASAQLVLGASYDAGRGVVRDRIHAHMWYNIAASSGDEKAAKFRDELANGMTTAQVAEAQKRARECVEKNYKGC